ncbi:MAG: hypothetical protein WC836_17290 [Desulfobacula sp.]
MTVLFLVSDIFGRTKALEAISERLSNVAPDIRIIDPYQGIDHGFETEAHAYDYFINRVGLETYQDILMDQLTSSGPDMMILIGFSVGASAIWAASDQPVFKRAKKAFCFYGSQIRHNTGIQPLFDIELIFPEQEPHFDVDELIRNLNTKSRVTCSKAPGLHGFMNKLSPHFDPACYEKFISYLKTSLIQ